MLNDILEASIAIKLILLIIFIIYLH